MNDHVEISMLLDFYGALLTDKQQDIMSLYYNENLSLAEISEITNTSRQAIHDITKRCNKQLIEYEEKLKLKELSFRSNEAKRTIVEALNGLKKDYEDKRLIDILNEVEQIIMREL